MLSNFFCRSRDIIVKLLAANIYEGEVLPFDVSINNLITPEIATTSVNGFAPNEIHNPTNETITATLKKPIPINYFETATYEIYKF